MFLFSKISQHGVPSKTNNCSYIPAEVPLNILPRGWRGKNQRRLEAPLPPALTACNSCYFHSWYWQLPIQFKTAVLNIYKQHTRRRCQVLSCKQMFYIGLYINRAYINTIFVSNSGQGRIDLHGRMCSVLQHMCIVQGKLDFFV